ncbi:hypothetical protein ES332_D03G000200v1 [Gossypium tomentosum]|uniref:Uncharacterized protein n=1 Tax=Gossypium tomentosum TaxID=34277 RepID=A0A5D2LHE8_GOSTO|nr:hypothetical protein ES332_D03G000200v1 [Gossypium tomentosum]
MDERFSVFRLKESGHIWDSVLKALNGHSDHGRIEMKKILPKISFTLSLQMRSKLLLLSQQYTFRFGDMVQQMKIY